MLASQAAALQTPSLPEREHGCRTTLLSGRKPHPPTQNGSVHTNASFWPTALLTVISRLRWLYKRFKVFANDSLSSLKHMGEIEFPVCPKCAEHCKIVWVTGPRATERSLAWLVIFMVALQCWRHSRLRDNKIESELLVHFVIWGKNEGSVTDWLECQHAAQPGWRSTPSGVLKQWFRNLGRLWRTPRSSSTLSVAHSLRTHGPAGPRREGSG